MTTEHIPALSGSQFCYFLAFWKCLILKYRKFFEKEKVNFVNFITRWLQSYFLRLIPIYQVNFSWIDLVYLIFINTLFGGWVIFQAFSIPVPEPKFYFKFQKFTLNDEEWRVKLFDGYKINPPKNWGSSLEILGHKKICFQSIL